ncbi:cell wall integrity and stress response component 4-like isoform X2 [Leguminivora glycinivorella]|uniref:cell wall integrity and stress response component 4-like isoform X2 n=1 Tax=Leguminivora glycinivorella TaxID=1035111 RepID=UPI00200E8795|nr:cell wall integrity and stress response component 4-like isoform X2 [Leguminivora glycinivorella]
MTASLTIKTQIWCLVGVVTVVMGAVVGLNGDHVCVVQQKYNITKRVKYRAPMSVRTYEWCFSMPPRCSKWSTEMRDLTRLETEERTAEVAVCCPGYKMKDVSCVPICPAGRTGSGCSEECPKNKWGPNCVNECKRCTKQGICSVVTGECQCQDGWQGERCEVRQTTPATMEELSVTKPVNISTSGPVHERTTMLSTTGTTTTKAPIITTVRIPITAATTTTTTLPTTPKPTTTSTTTTSTSTTTTSTTMRPVATTLLTSAPTSTVETTIQSSKSATVEAISNKESTRTTKHTNWNNVTLTSWVLSTDKSVPPTMMPFTTVSPIFIKTTFTKNAETSTDFIKETTARILPSKTENLELPSQSTKIFEMSTMNLRTAKPILITEPTVKEATRRPETTIKIYPTTIKFKPKEIWIKPAQKEPEHITAVMDKPDRSSVDLISVISIAGGVMMTVITVAVVIVMLERCRRPRYEDKMNSIRMEVMIDNNDGPPPYVRNIFNTPLPEPPRAEKCHYQPISTLDRNLKQFMRPVVVQTISPMMLENFRGILECHYDHLPRRSVEYPTLQARCSAAPSLSGCDELRQQRPDSLAESTIEALKCEAKLDVIDNTTSEPLYAEIPCWRPPSEHAIEVVNLNGEAVTEL